VKDDSSYFQHDFVVLAHRGSGMVSTLLNNLPVFQLIQEQATGDLFLQAEMRSGD
jgi:hypothetical protein